MQTRSVSFQSKITSSEWENMYLPDYRHLIQSFIHAINKYLLCFLYVQDTRRASKMNYTELPVKKFIIEIEK